MGGKFPTLSVTENGGYVFGLRNGLIKARSWPFTKQRPMVAINERRDEEGKKRKFGLGFVVLVILAVDVHIETWRNYGQTANHLVIRITFRKTDTHTVEPRLDGQTDRYTEDMIRKCDRKWKKDDREQGLGPTIC